MGQSLSQFDSALKDQQGRKKMPISKHFGGHGEEVMASMKKTYKSPQKAEEVFYATENKHKSSDSKVRSSMKSAMRKKGK